jgi:hypothetical protein
VGIRLSCLCNYKAIICSQINCRGLQTLCDLINPLLSCFLPNPIHIIPLVLLTWRKATTQGFYIEWQHPNHNSPTYNLDSGLSAHESFAKLNQKAKNGADTQSRTELFITVKWAHTITEQNIFVQHTHRLLELIWLLLELKMSSRSKLTYDTAR